MTPPAPQTHTGPIDTTIFQSRNYHIVRQTDITGICRQAGGRNLTAGVYRIQFSIKDCNAFGGFVYDAYTGWNSVSRIIIEEYMPRKYGHHEEYIPPNFAAIVTTVSSTGDQSIGLC